MYFLVCSTPLFAYHSHMFVTMCLLNVERKTDHTLGGYPSKFNSVNCWVVIRVTFNFFFFYIICGKLYWCRLKYWGNFIFGKIQYTCRTLTMSIQKEILLYINVLCWTDEFKITWIIVHQKNWRFITQIRYSTSVPLMCHIASDLRSMCSNQ